MSFYEILKAMLLLLTGANGLSGEVLASKTMD